MSNSTTHGLNNLERDLPSLLALHTSHPDISIITGSNLEYEPLLKPFNKTITTRPLAFISPQNEHELVATVQFCTSCTPPIPLTVRSGGHDLHGRYVAADAVLIDVSQLKDIRVSPDRTTVTLGAGVQGLELLRALDAQGLATAVGWCGRVGAPGWAAGGGYSVANGVWGLGVDNILGARVVMPGPDGRVVDTDDDAELLWAIRGAGLGNFGIILELRLKVYERPKQLAGLLAFPLDEAKRVLLDGVQQLSDTGRLPPNFNSDFIVLNMPDVGPTITFLWSWICDPDTEENFREGQRFLDEIKSVGTVLVDTVSETTMLAFHEFMDPMNNIPGYFNYLSGGALTRLTSDLIDILAKNPPPTRSCVLFHHAAHKATQDNPDAVFNIRENHYIYGIAGAADCTGTTEEEQAVWWSNRLFERIRGTPSVMKRGYYSFCRTENADAVTFFGEEKVARLKALKRRYNPQNAFPWAYPVLD